MLSSAVGQFYDPAHESVLPEVASEEELASANSLMAISSFGSTAIGFAASGLIASRCPIEWAFYLDALSFLFSAACILLIRIKALEVAESAGVQMVVRNLKVGVHFLFGSPALRSLFMVSIPALVAFGLTNSSTAAVCAAGAARHRVRVRFQEGMTSLGFVVGSLLMARCVRPDARRARGLRSASSGWRWLGLLMPWQARLRWRSASRSYPVS